MTRDLTDQKGWGYSKAKRWYRYSLPYLYRIVLLYPRKVSVPISYPLLL